MGAEVYTPGNDRHFDGLAEKFANSMYGASRGQLRLSLVQRHIRAHIPLPAGTPLLEAACAIAASRSIHAGSPSPSDQWPQRGVCHGERAGHHSPYALKPCLTLDLK